jgi:hypothetical protein
MKGKIKILGILALIMLITPVTISAATNVEEIKNNLDISNQSKEYVISATEDDVSGLVEFFRSECPDQVPYLENALANSKIYDETGKLIAIDLQLLENTLKDKTLSGGRNRLKFFNEMYIDSEFGDYQIGRTPYNTPFWDGPILGPIAPRWSFTSSNNKIKCYDKWHEVPNDVPQPDGNPLYNAKKIWFHDWAPGWHYDYENLKLGGVVTKIFVLGQPTDNNAVNLRSAVLMKLFYGFADAFPALIRNNQLLIQLGSYSNPQNR